MFRCCVCGKEIDESKMVLDEEMDTNYCENCYLAERSLE
ncbi:LIM domain-containing protein [Desulforamulus reducens]|nr:LIM domain-containing protein [Desulforamulus reducens]